VDKVNILTLKVGDKYHVEYVNRLYRGLKRNSTTPFDFYCYTEDNRGLDPDIIFVPLFPRKDVVKQWYKIDFHNWDIEGKNIILDIDQIILGDMDEILNYPVKRHEFGVVFRWWSNRTDLCKINGGFQVFNGGTTKHLYNKFYADPLYWQSYYIDRGLADGPVNGEQNFINDNTQLQFKFFPPEWFGKYTTSLHEMWHIQRNWRVKVNERDPYYLGSDFNESVKIVHFSNAENLIDDYNEEWISSNWY
jgi:hypothetical protein